MADCEAPFARILSAAEKMELAAELLTVSKEAELDQFLARLVKKARSGGPHPAGCGGGRRWGPRILEGRIS